MSKYIWQLNENQTAFNLECEIAAYAPLYIHGTHRCNLSQAENYFIITKDPLIQYIYIYTNSPVSDIVRLPHPWSGDSQGQKTFLVTSAHPLLTRKPATMTRVLKPPSIPIKLKLRS